VRTPASLFNTDFEGRQSAPTSAGDARPVSTTRVRPDRGMNLLNGTPWAVQVTVGAITVTAQATSSPDRHEKQGSGDLYLATSGTYRWPPVGTVLRSPVKVGVQWFPTLLFLVVAPAW
jgi:hypothetical protein